MKLGERMKRTRHMRGVTLEELGQKAGVSRATIHRYETGVIANIPSDRIEAIALALDVSPAYLMGWTDSPLPSVSHKVYPEKKASITIPILGTIAAGTPIFAEENFDDYIAIDSDIRANFALRVQGDSMIEANIYPGDLALIKKQATLENGEIGAILLGDTATLKYFRKTPDRIRLSAANQTMLDWPKDFSPEEAREISILGKLVAVIHLYD